MTRRREPLERIADALERMAAPVAEPIDWMAYPAYVWSGGNARPIASLDTTRLDQLRGIEQQKRHLHENIVRLAAGSAAHDCLLWGARGMGKSALVRAVVQNVHQQTGGKIALVQVAPGALDGVATLIDELSLQDRAFVLFLDDLGFGEGDKQENLALRSFLDGGVIARPSRVRLAVTSNRRTIVERSSDESEALHEGDERDDALALVDRFGLTLGFHPCDRQTYLDIVRGYAQPLALDVDEEEALAWAIARGNRSGRTAYQYVCELAGRGGKAI